MRFCTNVHLLIWMILQYHIFTIAQLHICIIVYLQIRTIMRLHFCTNDTWLFAQSRNCKFAQLGTCKLAQLCNCIFAQLYNWYLLICTIAQLHIYTIAYLPSIFVRLLYIHMPHTTFYRLEANIFRWILESSRPNTNPIYLPNAVYNSLSQMQNLSVCYILCTEIYPICKGFTGYMAQNFQMDSREFRAAGARGECGPNAGLSHWPSTVYNSLSYMLDLSMCFILWDISYISAMLYGSEFPDGFLGI